VHSTGSCWIMARSDAGCEMCPQPGERECRTESCAVVVAQCCMDAPALGLLLSAVSGARKRLEPRLTSDLHA
jgi:hypothetical protein